MHRILIVIFICLMTAAAFGGEVPQHSSDSKSGVSQPQYEVIYEANVRAPMRDGIMLSSDIWRPDAEGRFPVILSRTAYDNNTPVYDTLGRFYAARGYVYVVQDCRGRYDSDGVWRNTIFEDKDGYDTIEWCAAQPWSTGKTGMRGISYVGFTQWLAATQQPPHLTCLFSYGSPCSVYGDTWFSYGTFYLMDCITWAVLMQGRVRQNIGLYDWLEVVEHLPIIEMDDNLGHQISYWDELLSHPTFDEYWRGQSVAHLFDKIAVPAVSVSGWYDDGQHGTLNNYLGMVESGGSELARKNQKLIMGYWRHGGPYPGMGNNYTSLGVLDFGKGAFFDLMQYELRWFDRWLKDIDNGIDREPNVKLFIMGDNVWRDENEWPPARAQHTPYYLHSGGNSNTLNGDGLLNTEKPGDEPPDEYDYDPADPVPSSRGGGGARGGISADPMDQRPQEQRSDVLVYTSDVLGEDMEVTGPVKVILYASSSARDTDFCAKLVDVYPDGSAINVCYAASGFITARFRNGMEKEELIEPGRIYRYEINLRPTANVFKKGHRLRVEVSSSDFPVFNRNLNTGLNPFTTTEMVVAHQTIHHDSDHPSHIILPVIPR